MEHPLVMAKMSTSLRSPSSSPTMILRTLTILVAIQHWLMKKATKRPLESESHVAEVLLWIHNGEVVSLALVSRPSCIYRQDRAS